LGRLDARPGGPSHLLCRVSPAQVRTTGPTLRPRWLLAVPVMLLFAGVLWIEQYLAAGVHLREPLDYTCLEHAPDGWDEAIEATARWSGTPPRLECHLVHRTTGETAQWDSGSATTVPWLLRWVALLVAGSTVVTVVVTSVRRRRRGREREPA
jgi:hypothetical protein